MKRAPLRRGMTMIVAITLLTLAAAALVSVTQLVRDDAGRTLDEWRSAQLRALLVAARDYALVELRNGRPIDNVKIPLPAELAHATLVIDGGPDGDLLAVLATATLDGVSMSGRFDLEKSGDGWIVKRAALDPK